MIQELSTKERYRLEKEGARMAPLILGWRWVHRRVEAMTFLDDVSARRQATITFTLPQGHIAAVLTHPECSVNYVPLTLIGKNAMTRFDFTDERGATLPLLSSKEKGAMGSGVLIALAQLAITSSGLELETCIKDDLRVIAESDAEEAIGHRDSFLRRGKHHGNQYGLLCTLPSKRARFFRAMLFSLAVNHMVIVQIEQNPRTQMVVFSYDERIRRRYRSTRPIHLKVWDSLRRSIGWHAKRYWFPTPALGHGGTYHFEIYTPPGLKITESTLVASLYDIDNPTKPPSEFSRITAPPESRHLPRVFVRNAPTGAFGVVYVKMRARGSTVIRAATLTALGTAIILTVGRFFLPLFAAHQPKTSVEGAAALLLVIPTGASIYVANTNEHPMTTLVIYGVRLLTLIAGVSSLIASGILVLGQEGVAARWIWIGVTALLAWAPALALLITSIATWKEDEPLRIHWKRYRERPPQPEDPVPR